MAIEEEIDSQMERLSLNIAKHLEEVKELLKTKFFVEARRENTEFDSLIRCLDSYATEELRKTYDDL